MANERIGEQLVKNALITPDQLLEAQKAQKVSGTRLGSQLVKLGHISEEQLVDFLGKQYRLPSVILKSMSPDPEIVKLIPINVVQKYHAIPFDRNGSTLKVAMTDPTNIFAVDDLKFLTGYSIDVYVTSEDSLKWAIDHFYDQSASLDDALNSMEDLAGNVEVAMEGDELAVGDLEKEADQAPVIKLVNLTLVDAIKKGASDIHVEPYEKYMRIRYRLDGMLIEAMKPPIRLKNALVSRLKIMARLDIAERRLPQDGRIKLRVQGGKEVEFRVSVLPTLFGEKVVLRILDKSTLQLDMTKLGFEEEALSRFKEAIYKPWGMVLVTGPTGSGKTTTLYSALSELNKIDRNISTAEDPVEFNLPGVNQVQMHEEIGLTFATSLRSFLRQDPDIIMIGEMRDSISFTAAMSAADTGHLVLSTLHTTNAAQSVNRILDFFKADEREQIRRQLAGTLQAVICQRMVNTLAGGMTPALEIMINTPTVKKLIEENRLDKLPAAIETGIDDGMLNFNQALFNLVKAGKVSEQEALNKATNPQALEMNFKGIFLDEGRRILQ